jgi:hypothetical protein
MVINECNVLDDRCYIEWNYKDPELHYQVNIGYAYTQPPRKDVLMERLKVRRAVKDNLELEKSSKNRTCKWWGWLMVWLEH